MEDRAWSDLWSVVLGVGLGLIFIGIIVAYGCGTVLDVPSATTSTTFPEPVEPPPPPE